MKILHPFLLATLLGGLAAQTQNVVYADGDSSPTTGSGNAFPFGSVGIRYQAIFPHSLFGSSSLNIVTIRDILIAGSSRNIEIEIDDIEIKMGKTTQADVTSNWDTNLPPANATTVYRGPLRYRCIATPTSQWMGIGLPKPYLYLPTSNTENLCVEVIVWAAAKHANNFYFPRASSTLRRAFRYQWVSNQTQTPLTGTAGCRMGFVLNNGNIATAGTGCSGSNGQLKMSNDTWPQLGGTVTFSVDNAVATQVGFMVIGAKVIALDLGIAGSPGCILWNDPLIGVPVVTDATGAAKLPAAIPRNTPSGTLYAHFLVPDAGRLTTSDFQTIIIGQ